MFRKEVLILPSLFMLGFAQMADAACVEKYDIISAHNEEVAKAYEGVVEHQDRYRYYHELKVKVEKDPLNPFALIYDLLSQPSDNFKSSEVAKDEVPDDTKRVIATKIWLDQEQVRDLLVDSFRYAYGNDAFMQLWGELSQDGFPGTRDDVANAINQANLSGNFCAEKPKTVFVQNRWGKLYSTDMLTLESFEKIKYSIESGAWQAEPMPEPTQPTIAYPQNPWNSYP